MSGFTWDEEMREKLIRAVNSGDYVKINQVIMKIQKPYIDKLNKLKEQLDELSRSL